MLFIGLRAFMALCITIEKSRHRVLRSSSRPSRTMSRPRKVTLPSTTSPGGESSCATAKSSVDFPDPDSPTTPRNSPGSTVKLTRSTARTPPVPSRYSTERPSTSSSGSATPPPHRPKRGVPDLVERVVQECEPGSQNGHRRARPQCPEGVAGLERSRLLRVVEHRPPHQLAAVSQTQELEAGRESDLEDGERQERGRQKGGHRGH